MKSVELFVSVGLASAVSLSAVGIVNASKYRLVNEEISEEVSTVLIAEGEEDGEDATELSPGEQANADFQDKISGKELLSELQNGGYVIYFRHAQTEKKNADQVTVDVNNCSTQRVLSEVGLQQALTIGEGFETSEIPIGTVTTSEYCRAWSTAALAFGYYEKDSALNFLPVEDYTDEQVEQIKANITPLLTAVPEDGTNSIIVGHDNFESATGIYPDPQGIAYIVKPDDNGGFEVVANMLPEEWGEL